MANQITDGRTLLFDGGDGTGGQPDDLTGAASGLTDTSTFLEGSTSYTYSQSNARAGLLFDAGTAQNYANNHFYITCNSGVVGLMLTKANAGFTIRFCGATVTDWFEVYVGGSDSWPNSIQGGWVNFVIDIEDARAAAIVGTVGGVNGTTPATSAIRYVGITCNLTIMPKMADNTWLDTIHRLPDGSPGVIIEGRNGGSTDWNSADIASQLGSGQMIFFQGAGGAWVLSAPIQFGINDTTTHGFTDTNAIYLWDDQEFVAADSYGITALGNSGGITNVTFGVKTGTGDAATGAQGLVISAASGGVRWDMDFDDPNLDAIGMFGSQFQHGGDFQLDLAAVSVIGCTFLDCTSARTDNAGDFLRNKIIDANTGDGVAFITTDDISDIVFCEFEFSDGHAIELTTPRVATQSSKGNLFTGYALQAGNANDRALYNNSAGLVTIGVTDSGDSPTFRNGTSASTVVNNNQTIEILGVTEGTRCVIEQDSDGAELLNALAFTDDGQGGFKADTTFNYSSDTPVRVSAASSGKVVAGLAEDGGAFVDETVQANDSRTGAGNTMTLLPAVPASVDAYNFGHTEQFLQMDQDVLTAGAGTYTLAWEFWNGSIWTALPGLSDGSNNYKNSGRSRVGWTTPTGWTARSLTNQPGPTNLFYIRARFVSGTVTTVPVGRTARLDVPLYLRWETGATIVSTGLSAKATWVEDNVASFD